MMRTPTSRYLALALITLAAACGGDDGTDIEDVLADFNGAAIQEAMTGVSEPLEATGDARSSLQIALSSLYEQGVEFAPESAARRAAPEAFQARVRTLAVRPMVAFPTAIQGKTFVYSETEMGWVVDEDRTGAPADGVRIIFYQMSAGSPTSATELGYVDLTDEDDGATQGLGARIVRFADNAVLADFVQTWSETMTSSGESWTFNASGTLGDGTTNIDFVISETGSDSSSGDEVYSFSMLFTGPQGSYEWAIDGAYTASNDTDQSDQAVTVMNGSVATVLDLHFTDVGETSTGDGTLSHRGVVIADILLEDGSQDIGLSRPGGGSFSQTQEQELRLVVLNMVFTGLTLLFSSPLLFL